MDRTERFYKIQRLLNERSVVPIDVFLDALEVSRATFKRDLEYLRDRFSMPIVWDRRMGGYRLDESDPAHRTYQLPGLWFSAAEVYALLAMDSLLEQLQPGLLAPQIGPLRARIRKLLEGADHSVEELSRRIRVLQIGSRAVEPKHFQTIAAALLSRRRLGIVHYKRQTDERLEREVSPQRLVHYRDNWYLDSWCHMRRALRTFAVDAIESAVLTGKRAREMPDEKLDAVLGAGFGIFSGEETQTAVLQFSPLRARWVAGEIWHSRQSGDLQLDGSYILRVPYSDPRELVMDILKYGADVEVLAPPELRRQVAAALEATAARYRTD